MPDSTRVKTKTFTYMAWRHMRQICNNKKSVSYDPIAKIYPRWLVYDNFLKDMGEKPEGMVLCRIDPSFGFDPTNCRWMTRREAAQHRKYRAIYIEGLGQMEDHAYSLPEVMRIKRCTLSLHTVKARLRLGWTLSKALTTPTPKIRVISLEGSV
jgi:hypothetical protein